MRIITLNLNGLRSAKRKGVLPWLAGQNADAIALQETRLQEKERLAEDFSIEGYTGYFVDVDAEGRWLQADFGDLSIVSLYLPSGSSGEQRQAFKFQVLEWLADKFAALARDGRRYIVCGDYNIAHRPIDLKNWRGNQKNSGFLPEERAWMERLLVDERWVDTHRRLKPDVAEYTWWSNRGQARANDVGWRIDYQLASPDLLHAPGEARVYRDAWFSDHAPLIVDYDLKRLNRAA